jgi:hypothetical protein
VAAARPAAAARPEDDRLPAAESASMASAAQPKSECLVVFFFCKYLSKSKSKFYMYQKFYIC